jgi:adenylate kinase family enzyme
VKETKLIVLRGPSGSGKSAVAKKLFEGASRRTVHVDQDHYRFIFNPPGGGTKPNIDSIHKMIKSNTLIALEDGCDVILDGILSVKSYSEVLDEIFNKHEGESYMFYFDVSFEETLRRHSTRPNKAKDFGEAEMREWFPASHRSNHELEQIIPESFSIDETIRFIKKVSNL